jgi:hypothetical protein
MEKNDSTLKGKFSDFLKKIVEIKNEIFEELKKYPKWVTIVSILIPFVGLYFIWKNKLFVFNTRIIVTVILLVLLTLGYNNSGSIPGSRFLPGLSYNGTYEGVTDNGDISVVISGSSYSGKYINMSGEPERFYGVVKHNDLYSEPDFSQYGEGQLSQKGWIDTEKGEVHYWGGNKMFILKR